MKKNKMNVVIAQSGGPSMVINCSLVGAIMSAKRFNSRFGDILGARHGIQGILNDEYVDLRKLNHHQLISLGATPSSALGSCRMKPTAEDCRAIFECFKRRNVGYFYYIGGNDSADAARIIAEAAEEEGYPLICWHLPKTIDNDLRSCDFTPGYASAANFVARAFIGDDLDNRALGGVKINVVMGRDAGFLTAASALARKREDDGPHLIYLPEVPFSTEKFVKDVQAAMKKYGRCVVAVSEGIRDKDGASIGAKLADGETDSHGNVQMSGTGALGDHLAKLLKAKCGIKRVRADTFGYLQRSFPGMQSKVDVSIAIDSAYFAVDYSLKCAAHGVKSGTVAILRDKGKKFSYQCRPRPIDEAAKLTRSMPKEFIARNGHDVTPAFLDYARPLVGELPVIEVL